MYQHWFLRSTKTKKKSIIKKSKTAEYIATQKNLFVVILLSKTCLPVIYIYRQLYECAKKQKKSPKSTTQRNPN